MNRIALSIPCFLLFGSLVACSANAHPETPNDVAKEQTLERTDQRADQQSDRIELSADQRKESADARADQQKAEVDQATAAQKQQIEEQADRSKFDTELKARLDKVDVRIADASSKAPKATPANRAKAKELLKSAKEQRANLGDSHAKLSTVPADRWEPTKKQIETSMKTLEREVDELELLVAS